MLLYQEFSPLMQIRAKLPSFIATFPFPDFLSHFISNTGQCSGRLFPKLWVKLPSASEKETQNMQQIHLGIYWGRVYRPEDVGMQRETERAWCSLELKGAGPCLS